MVTNNKVLTVSYGTFSCTLEGFDNSFDTMKAIAEYFRDLAADDRYFGAEPPTPDAEMLARIAEREIERRVSARTEAGAIYLSANDEQARPEPTETPSDAPQEETVAEATPEIAAGASAPDEAAEAPLETRTEDAPEIEEIEVEDVTDDILKAVNAAPEQDADAPTPETAEESVAEHHEEEIAEASPDQTDDIAESWEENEAPDIPEAEDHAEETAFAEAELVEPEDAFEPADDSIAAKLQRIRAVVSKSAQEPEEDDFSEDEHAESFLADTRREIESVLKLDDEMAAAAAQDDAESVAEDSAEAGNAPTTMRARVLRMKKSDFDAAVSEGLLEAEPEEDELDEDTSPRAGAEAQDPSSTLSPEDEAELLAELAQVEAELNRGDAAGETAPVAPKRPKALSDAGSDMSRLLRETDNHMDEPEGNRRRQAIAHLRAAVAATKAEKKASEGKPEADQTEVYREDLASVVGQSPNRSGGRAPETVRPAPLKLVAEQRIDAPQQDDTPQEAQSDAPVAGETPRAPVRPRRVSSVDRQEASAAPRKGAAASPAATDASSFAEYAESMGATRLPDLLEAAAAYLTYVEGHEKFSRPQIIRMARNVDEDNCSREDTLRTFGQLLREKKIEKISGGRFTVSENIAYKPEDRAAG